MNPELFSILGQIAGLAGITIGLILVIFREVIQKKIFSTLTKEQSFKLLRLIIVLSFIIGVLGLSFWFFNQQLLDDTGSHKSSYDPNTSERINFDVAEFLPIDSLNHKISTFNLNPTDPFLTVRFKSSKWNFSTDIDVSPNMKLGVLKYAIIEHFQLIDHVNFGLNEYRVSGNSISPVWILRVNGNDIEINEQLMTLDDYAVKNNDLITLKIGWSFALFTRGIRPNMPSKEFSAEIPIDDIQTVIKRRNKEPILPEIILL